MSKGNWKLEKYLECLKNEVDALDNCVIERNAKSSLNNRERCPMSNNPFTIATLVNTTQNESKRKESRYRTYKKEHVRSLVRMLKTENVKVKSVLLLVSETKTCHSEL